MDPGRGRFGCLPAWNVELCQCPGGFSGGFDPSGPRQLFLDRLGTDSRGPTACAGWFVAPAIAAAHTASSCRSARTGNANVNVDPFPALDSTQIRPPCSSTMRLAMDRPSPVLPCFLALWLSACWNSSKSLC